MAVPSKPAFALAVMLKLDYASQSEYGSAFGAANGYGAAHDWLEGEGLDYELVLEMLYRCGWLTQQAQFALGEAQEAVATGRLWDLVPGSRLQGRLPKKRATGQ